MTRLSHLVSWWHRRLCRALGMRIEVIGAPAPGVLLVANHVSWLDIPVIGAQGPIGFVSKAEVEHWPLIGWMARIADTLFMARGGNETSDTVRRVQERLRAGSLVAVFPEGTTTDGTRLKRFHARLLAAGQCPGVRVQPLALRFGNEGTPDPVAPFVGKDALLPHLLRLIRHPGVRAQLHFLPPIDGSSLSRREISDLCRGAIAAALGMHDPPTSPSNRAKSAGAEQASTILPLVEAT
jgi:1-acyl-sn-glycerol-3-phosphate acyltransferase